MKAPSLFTEGQSIFALQKMFATVDAACTLAGDVSLGAYALLVTLAESEGGIPLKSIESDFKASEDPLPYVESLISKELAERIRSATDRRGFALKITPKGRARIALVDESIAAGLIAANREWSEAEFEYLIMKIHKLSTAVEAQCKVTTLFSGAFLLRMFWYHHLVVEVAAYFAMSSLQLALLYAFADAEEASISPALARQMNTPLNLLELQVDDLVKKGLICDTHSCELTEKGRQRSVDATNMISTHLNQLAEGGSEESLTASEALGEYSLFLYTKQSKESDKPTGLQSVGQSFSQRVTALSALFGALAQLFSYPSREELAEISTREFFEECLSLVDTAAIERGTLDDLMAAIEENRKHEDFSDRERFRAEYTRLFIVPPILIKLRGSHWVKNRTALSKSRGEEHAVSQVYRQLGLRTQQGVDDPPSHLVTELDYLHYVIRAEARAWEGNDVANAHEWRKLSNGFMKDHFVDLAQGVSASIPQHSNNSLLLFRAALLRAVVSEGLFE